MKEPKQTIDYNNSVFINCPFDKAYKSLLYATIFTIFDCGFIARCALEENDSSQIRLEKIYSIISECRYGIHDISRTELDSSSNLPRFNMPFELGVFLGAKKFGSDYQSKKKCLILDTDQYRYQQFISDISGQDICAHHNNPEDVVKSIRNWLRDTSRRTTIPGGPEIWRHYNLFISDLPGMCTESSLDVNDLIFNDYAWLVVEWLRVNEELKKSNRYFINK